MRHLRTLVPTVLALAAFAACSSESSVEPAATSSTLPAGSTTTTVAASVPPSSTAPATDVATTVPATTPAPVTTAAGGSGGGSPTTEVEELPDLGRAPAPTSPSWFTAGAEEGDPEVSAGVGACEPFYDAIGAGTYSVARCGVWNANGGQRMWTVTKGAAGTSRFFAIVWQQAAPNVWRPVLRATEEAAGQWADVVLRTGNIDSGPNDELVAGVRIAGTGGYLNVEIVDIRSGNPRVVAVSPLGDKGIAVLVPGGGVDVWSAVYDPADPLCCPSTFALNSLLPSSTGWVVAEGVGLPAGDPMIPASQF